MTATAVITTGRAPRRGARGGMTRRRPVDWLLLALVVVGALLVLAPFYLVLVNSFKSPVDYATSGPLAPVPLVPLAGPAALVARPSVCADCRPVIAPTPLRPLVAHGYSW